MNTILITYGIYLFLSAILVFVVGFLFYKAGNGYISHLFPNDIHLAHNLNKLLLIAYYLLNLGFILYFLQQINEINHWNQAVQFIVQHLSTNIITIAVIHYANLIWLRILAKKYFLKP